MTIIDTPAPVLASRCNGCELPAGSLPEYVLLAAAEDYADAEEAVRRGEGTYNQRNGHFWCSDCYIDAGMPLGVAA